MNVLVVVVVGAVLVSLHRVQFQIYISNVLFVRMVGWVCCVRVHMFVFVCRYVSVNKCALCVCDQKGETAEKFALSQGKSEAAAVLRAFAVEQVPTACPCCCYCFCW